MKGFTSKQLKCLLAGLMLMLCYGLSNNTVSYFISPVSEALGISRAAFNLYYSIMSVVTLVCTPFIGQLLQRVDLRKVMLLGGVVGGMSLMIFSFCPAIQFFYVVAVFFGIVQNGTTNVSAVVIVNRAFSGSSNNGIATGIIMAGTGICSTIMSLILPSFIINYTWRGGYRLEGILWFAMFALAILLVGDVAVAPASGAKQAKGTAVSQPGATYAQAIKSPVLYLLIACVVVLTLDTIFVQHMPAFFQELGSDAVAAGKIMSVCSIVLIIGKICLGGIYDRMGGIKTVIFNIGCLIIGYYIMLIGGTFCMWAGALISVFGMCCTTVLLPLITKHVFGEKEFASIWSMISMSVALGCAIGSPLWGTIYDLFGSYKPAVAIFPIVEAVDLALIIFLMLRFKADYWEK